jgi:hypothetical protein
MLFGTAFSRGLELCAKKEVEGDGGVCSSAVLNVSVIGRACRILMGEVSDAGTYTSTLCESALAVGRIFVWPVLTTTLCDLTEACSAAQQPRHAACQRTCGGGTARSRVQPRTGGGSPQAGRMPQMQTPSRGRSQVAMSVLVAGSSWLNLLDEVGRLSSCLDLLG